MTQRATLFSGRGGGAFAGTLAANRDLRGGRFGRIARERGVRETRGSTELLGRRRHGDHSRHDRLFGAWGVMTRGNGSLIDLRRRSGEVSGRGEEFGRLSAFVRVARARHRRRGAIEETQSRSVDHHLEVRVIETPNGGLSGLSGSLKGQVEIRHERLRMVFPARARERVPSVEVRGAKARAIEAAFARREFRASDGRVRRPKTRRRRGLASLVGPADEVAG